MDLLNQIIKVYKIYRPQYDLKDDDEKEQILATIKELDEDLAEAFPKELVDFECQLTDYNTEAFLKKILGLLKTL